MENDQDILANLTFAQNFTRAAWVKGDEVERAQLWIAENIITEVIESRRAMAGIGDATNVR